MSGATLATKDAVDPLIHKGYLDELADAYVPAGMDRKDPRVSPLYRRPARASRRVLIQVGSAETLLGDATRFAAAAGAADVAVDARNLAAHDPCVSGVERASGTGPPGAHAGRGVHAPVAVVAGTVQDFQRANLNGATLDGNGTT